MPTEASCMSSISSSSGISSSRRRAEAILKLLTGGCFSEVNIRRVLGDSPDTSKALRIRWNAESSLRSDGLKWMLLKQGELKRSGTGGKKDPYIYSIARE